MQRNFIIPVFVFITAVFLYSVSFTGCDSDPVAPSQPVIFSKDVLPIFHQNCALSGCHRSGFQNEDKLDLSSWNSLMTGGFEYGAAVVPYSSYWSALVSHINSDSGLSIVATPRMPLYRPGVSNGQPLSPSNIRTIMQWIDEGAKDDNGTVAFSMIPRKAFITNQASDYVAVVNTDNNFLVRLIPVGGRQGGNLLSVPHHITVDNQGRYFYVALIGEGYVEKFDAMTYEKTGRLFLGSSPSEVFLTSPGVKGYVTNWDATGADRSVKIIDTRSMQQTGIVSSIRMKATHGGRVTHNDNYFIAASQLSEYIIIINTITDQIEDEIPVASDVPPNGNGTAKYLPYGVAISQDDKYALITCPRSNDVRVLDLNTRTIIKIIQVGQYPVMIEVSPDNKWCYVPNRNSGTISVIDMNILEVVYTIEDVGSQPHGVDFTEDGKYAYISCESLEPNNPYIHHPVTQSVRPGTTAVIDIPAGHVKIYDIEMASFPNGIAITPGKGN